MDKMDANSPSKIALKQNNINPQDFYDYKSSQLSSLAQLAINSKSITGTDTQKSAIKSELQKM
jgi:hypothetical protein